MNYCALLVGVVVALCCARGAEAGNDKVVFCYYGTWATWRPENGKFDVENIDPSLCTHLGYSFFGIGDNGELRSLDAYLDLEENWGRGNIKKFNALKQANRSLKTLAVVGGWNEGSVKYSAVAADAGKRRRFIDSAVQLLKQHGFDGLDLDWEYPGQRGGSASDKKNYVTWIKEIKNEFKKHNLLLTVAVAATPTSAGQSYNIAEMAKYLDLINVMTYDLHSAWDGKTGMNAPLYAGRADVSTFEKELNVDAVINYWLKQGAPASKLVLGLGFYGRAFTLQNPGQTTPGSPTAGPGLAGPLTREQGFLGYNEICSDGSWNRIWDESQKTPYAYKGNQWVGYDDPKSIDLKVKYALQKKLAGVMIWSIDTDDFRGVCGQGAFPLLTQVNQSIGRR